MENKIIQPKPVKERDNKDLLNLVCELSGRLALNDSKPIHDAYVEAVTELEKRLSPEPKEAVGVEEIYKPLAKKYSENRGWNIGINAPYFKEVILPTITEYSSLLLAEKDNRLKLKDAVNVEFRLKIENLEQSLASKEREIEGWKEKDEQQCKVYDKLAADLNYWKERCEQCEKVLDTVNSNGGMLSYDVEAKIKWQTLKSKQP